MKFASKFRNAVFYNRLLVEKEDKIISLFPSTKIIPYYSFDNFIRYRNNIHFMIDYNEENECFNIGIQKKSFTSMNKLNIDHPLINFDKILQLYSSYNENSIIPAKHLIYASNNSLLIVDHFSKFINQHKLVFPKDLFRGFQIRESSIEDKNFFMIIIKLYIPDLEYNNIWTSIEIELINHFLNFDNNLNLASIYKQITDKDYQSTNSDEFVEIYKKDDLIQKINDIYFKISPGAFFQVNIKTATIIYNLVKRIYLQSLSNYKIIYDDVYILDICCGTGTLGIFLSDYCNQVYGFEINKHAINDCIFNSKYNNKKNTKYIEGPVEETINLVLPLVDSTKKLIPIINPPKRGLYKPVIEILLKNQEKIHFFIYVSCNPKSFYRDYNLLKTQYKIEYIHIIDQFPLTNDVEIIVLLKNILI